MFVSSPNNGIINVIFSVLLLNVFLITELEVTDGHPASECLTVGNMLSLCCCLMLCWNAACICASFGF